MKRSQRFLPRKLKGKAKKEAVRLAIAKRFERRQKPFRKA